MTPLLRIPFGLERLPRTFIPNDTRVPSATVGTDRLRLNSEPLPPDAVPLTIGDHPTRFAAYRDWLFGLCGDYAPRRRQFISSYLAFVAAHLAAHRAELVEQLHRYHGLYEPEDWVWSAMRPLPRAWLPAGELMLPADIVFWDGFEAIAIELAERRTERLTAFEAAGINLVRVEPQVLSADFMKLADVLPNSFCRFWECQTLPSSPFRRPIPPGVLRPVTG